MNKFNDVFSAVKRYYYSQKNLKDPCNFEVIAEDAGITFDKLDFYLKHIQDMGLIKYSMEEKYLFLTSFGAKQQSLFKNPGNNTED